MKKSFDYGVVLVERLKKANGVFLDAKSVAMAHALSPAFMEKIAQNLRRAGWLESKRGLGGGYRLKEPNVITTQNIFEFFNKSFAVCPINRLTKKS